MQEALHGRIQMHQEEPELHAASDYHQWIQSQLANWKVELLEPETSDSTIGCECVARYGKHLVVRITHDRGTNILFVGTEAPNDLYPLEDVAVYLGKLEPEHLYQMISVDPTREPPNPPLSLTEALQLLSQNAKTLDSEFSFGNHNFRQELRNVSDQFNDAWEKAIKHQPPDLGLSR